MQEEIDWGLSNAFGKIKLELYRQKNFAEFYRDLYILSFLILYEVLRMG